MPLYELTCIARLYREALNRADGSRAMADGAKKFVIPLVRSSVLHILDRNGVVRHVQRQSAGELSYRMRNHQEIFTHGCVWSMQFDASPAVMNSLRRELKFDEKVIRFGIVRLGSKLRDITRHVPADKM